ncbi:unnamed protein product [Chironomus riparius]|uniref:Adenosine deaminase domain-containing protein n=1 Tax=Chironomus riparius TaxID=315576 RepID=A0A9N9WMF8_9DIPT|nr:unnamed protein product [Chironomus riparius]
MDEFVKNMPKIELHAHLNGSLSNSTLCKLIELKKKNQGSAEENMAFYHTFDADESLEKCFEKFKLAHDLVNSKEAVKLALCCVIDEFSKENVIYLEIRSAPRSTAFMSKEEYLQAVIDQIILCQESHPTIMVKYIPSINISYGTKEAEENYKLFYEFRNKYPDLICGMDLSGDPIKGKFSDVKKVFDQARADGFRFAIHCAESLDENEILEKLEFMASGDRIGHGTFIEESNTEIWNLFTSKHLPIELCLTSNVLCQSVKKYEDHHISRFIRKYPVMICTDDYGVFSTSLTRELKICVDVFGLTKSELIDLTVTANKYSFARPEERQLISDKIEAFKAEAVLD